MSLPKAIPESQWKMFHKELDVAGGYEIRYTRTTRCIIFTEGEDKLWRYDLWTQEWLNMMVGPRGLMPEHLPKNVREAERIDEPTWFLTHSSAEPV